MEGILSKPKIYWGLLMTIQRKKFSSSNLKKKMKIREIVQLGKKK